MDEKAQIQVLDHTQPLLPMRPGQVERRTHDYRRHGTTSLFVALDVTSGRMIGQFHQRHRARGFRQFLDTIDANVTVLVIDPEQMDWISTAIGGRWQAVSETLEPGSKPLMGLKGLLFTKYRLRVYRRVSS